MFSATLMIEKKATTLSQKIEKKYKCTWQRSKQLQHIFQQTSCPQVWPHCD